jgi:hypothetical protein
MAEHRAGIAEAEIVEPVAVDIDRVAPLASATTIDRERASASPSSSASARRRVSSGRG